jgi:hypothetical protein
MKRITCFVVVTMVAMTGVSNGSSPALAMKPWTINPKFKLRPCVAQAQEQTPIETLDTLEDVNRLMREINSRNDISSPDYISNSLERIMALARDTGKTTTDKQKIKQKLAVLDKMQRVFSNVYPEVQTGIRDIMKEFNTNSNKEDWYSNSHYRDLGNQIWQGMYDGNAFYPGMYDLDEVCSVIQILGTRDFENFKNNIVPQLKKQGLRMHIPLEISKRMAQEEARKLTDSFRTPSE